MDVGGFQVSTWPMLSTAQRDVGCRYYGSVQLQSPDPSHPINGIIAVKINPALTHVVKGDSQLRYLARHSEIGAQAAQLLRELRSTLARPVFALNVAHLLQFCFICVLQIHL